MNFEMGFYDSFNDVFDSLYLFMCMCVSLHAVAL